MSARARRSSWLVWLAGSGVYFLAFLHRASLGVAGTKAIDHLDISATELGSFVMVQLGLYATMQVPAGLAIDRWGARRVLLVATLAMGCAQLGFAFAVNYPTALAARALLGVGDAAVFIAVLRLAALWFPSRRYAVLTSATGLMGMAGNLAATVPLALALDDFGWTRTFAVTGVSSLVYALLLLRPAVAAPYRPPTPTIADSTDSPGVPPRRASVARQAVADVRAAWSRRETRLGFWTHQATMTPGAVISFVWGYPYLTQGLGYSNAAAASQLSIYVFATVVASFIVGPLAGRYRPWRAAMGVAVSVGALLAVVMLVAWPSGQPPAMVVTLALILLAIGAPASQIGFHLARDYNEPVRMSTATGLVNVGGFAGAMVGAIAIGAVLDQRTGGAVPGLADYRWALGALALISAVSNTVLLATLMRVRHDVLRRMARGHDVVVAITERSWDRLYRRARRALKGA